MKSMNRLLRWLLHRFPVSFRERYGDELVDLLNSLTKDTRSHSGWLGVVRLWAFQATDLTRSAIAERRAARLSQPSEPQATSRQRSNRSMDGLIQDFRYAIRRLTKNPASTAVAVFSLALALGANSAVFAILNPLLIRPVIPLRAGEVVNVYTPRQSADRSYRPFSFREFSLLRESDEVFVDVAAFRPTMVGIGEPLGAGMRRHFGFVVSDNYFDLLGTAPVAGRFFLPEESGPSASVPVAVASHAMWQRHGGGADFVGRTTMINSTPWTIIGVAPAGFSGGNALLAPDIWLPLGMSSLLGGAFGNASGGRSLTDPGNFALHLVARLRPDVTVQGARSRLAAVAVRLSESAPDNAQGARGLEIEPPSRFNIDTEPASDGPLLVFGLLLLSMSAVVLLVACLNLANLFLAQGTSRRGELSLRLALGASRRRVVRLLFVEGLVVAVLGGAVGLLLSYAANTLLLDSLGRSSAFASMGLTLALDVTPDTRVLLATLIFCGMASLVFSIGPALRVTQTDPGGYLSLRASDLHTTDRWGQLFSGRNCLLMGQLGLSLTLLFSAALFFRGAHAAARLDPGFEPEGDLVAELDYSLSDWSDLAVRQRLTLAVDTLRTLPGVRDIALASHLPYGNVTQSLEVTAVRGNLARTRGRVTAISSGYFQAIGVKLLRGRDFSELEWRSRGNPPVAIIDERMARTLFSIEDPIGRYLQPVNPPGDRGSGRMEIVGIVSAHREDLLSEQPPARIFIPLGQDSVARAFVHLRVAGPTIPDALPEQVRRTLLSVDGEIPLVRLAPFTTIMETNMELWAVRFAAILFGAFGLIALLLAVIGVYGVRAFMVARRTREIGIRVALGAQPSHLLAVLTMQGAVHIGIGLSVGLILSLATGRLLASMLLRVSPNDPLSLAAGALPLAAAALLATWLPARRAVRTDPMMTLRHE
ncbi:MAG: hypothetical protein AMS18_13105 [Gemmatimonas sp. SG8_17]|nr:MAG: hypothetical protein AMS18_13105 [Gemmatimonas sp. SG8_17]